MNRATLKAVGAELAFCLPVAYFLTTYPYRYGELVPWGEFPALLTVPSLALLSLSPIFLSLRPIVHLVRQRAGANDRIERQLSTISLKAFLVACITLYFGADFWQNILWKTLVTAPWIGSLVGSIPDLRFPIFFVGLVLLLIPFHFMNPTSFIHQRTPITYMDVRTIRRLHRIANRSPWRLSELVTPYPECAEVQVNSIVPLLSGIRGPASLEIVGCRNTVAILSGRKQGDYYDLSRALALVYRSMRTCDFVETRDLAVRVGHYVAAAYATFSDNELCSLHDFDKSNDILSNLGSVLTNLEKGCGGHIQVIFSRRSYDSHASRMLRSIARTSDTQHPAHLPSELRRIALEIRRKTSQPTFSVGINVLAWAPTPQLAESTLEAICQTISLHGDYGFIHMKRANGYDVCRHAYLHKPRGELPLSNRELSNLIHLPSRPGRGLPIVRSSPGTAGRSSPTAEDDVKAGWELD